MVILGQFIFTVCLLVGGASATREGLNLFPGEDWNTGYVDVGRNKSLFYYFFRARNKSLANPPLVIWLEGGPGYSTAIGVWSEGGPYIVNNVTKQIERNPFAWNEVADTLFVDQPADTPFSKTSDLNNLCTSEVCVATDFYNFLLGFYAIYPEYVGRPLYISGVSYGGHYVPAIAGRLLREKNPQFALKGIAIGNGLVDLYTQLPSYPLYLYMNNFINVFQYVIFETAVVVCHVAADFHIEPLQWPCSFIFFAFHNVSNIKANPYDMSNTTDPYEFVDTKLADYLNKPDVQQALGVNKTFSSFSVAAYNAMKPDWPLSLSPELVLALESNVKVYLYFGDTDYVCNWMSGEALANSLMWTGREVYTLLPLCVGLSHRIIGLKYRQCRYCPNGGSRKIHPSCSRNG